MPRIFQGREDLPVSFKDFLNHVISIQAQEERLRNAVTVIGVRKMSRHRILTMRISQLSSDSYPHFEVLGVT